METQSRFDLKVAIENWRTGLAAQSNLTTEVRRELETHLRDSINELQQRGLNDEETFWLAQRRVGQPGQLGHEFVIADPAAIWRERLFWMALAALLIWLWNVTAAVISQVVTNSIVNATIRWPGLVPGLLPYRDLLCQVIRIAILVLPIGGVALHLAKGRLNAGSRLASWFRYRTPLAIVLVAWSLIMPAFTTWAISQSPMYHPLPANGPNIVTSMSFPFWRNLFYSLSIPLMLLALLARLTPIRRSKKSALV